MLLPPQFQSEPLKTLGPPIRKNEEKKPVEVEVRPGIYRVNGKLETRIRENEPADQYPSWVPVPPAPVLTEVVSEVDIPLPEVRGFKVGDRVMACSGVATLLCRHTTPITGDGKEWWQYRYDSGRVDHGSVNAL